MQQEQMECERLSALLDSALDEHEWNATIDMVMTEDGMQQYAVYQFIGDVLRSPEMAHYPLRHSENILMGLRAQLKNEPVPSSSSASVSRVGGSECELATENPRNAQILHQKISPISNSSPVKAEHFSSPANDSIFRWKMLAGVASCAAVLGMVWGSGVLGQGGAGAQWASAPVNGATPSAQITISPASDADKNKALPSSADLLIFASSATPASNGSSSAMSSPDMNGAMLESPPATLAGRGALASSEMTTDSSGAATMIRDPRLDELMAAHRQFGGAAALQLPAEFLRNANFEGRTR